MTGVEILVAIIGCVSLGALLVLMFIGIHSCEKTENKKRELMEEVTRYYKKRNEMFEKEDN